MTNLLIAYFGINIIITIIYCMLYLVYNKKLFMQRRDYYIFTASLLAGTLVIVGILIVNIVELIFKIIKRHVKKIFN